MNFFKQFGQGLSKGASGAFLDGIGSLFTIGAQKRAATTAYKRQKEFSKEMFDMTNAYNTPAMQMERLRKAGLNPALMYGQGNVGNASAVTAGAPQANVSGPQLAQSAAAGAQISLVQAQDDKLRAEADNIREQTALTGKQGAKVLAEILNIGAQKAQTIQQTLNLKTMGEVLKFDKAIKSIESDRAKNKGILKGDTIGNILGILNLDPQNNPTDRKIIQGAFTAYFGAKVAGDIMKSVLSFKDAIKPKFIPKKPFKKGGN